MECKCNRVKIDLNLISMLEDELTSINEGKIKSFLMRQDSWEILNKEKISQSFCNIFRRYKDNPSLTQVQDSLGNDFNSKEEQANFNNSFYQNIYKKNISQ